jgi:segregation and condensation protein B
MLRLSALLEALLFAASGPVEKARLKKALGVEAGVLIDALEELKAGLVGHGLTIIETADEIELRTAAEAAEAVKHLREDEFSRDLGKGSLETLAVIAYQGGATRGQIDWVRGVNSTAALRTLLLRGLVVGTEDPADKRRVRYALTTDALAHLGIAGSAGLPRASELQGALRTALEAREPAAA